MIRTLISAAPLLLGVAILLTGQGLLGVLLPVRANLESFSTLAIAVMGGVYFLGFTAGCLFGSGLVRRVGHVRVFAAMTAAASAVPLLHGLWPDAWWWWLLRFVTGYCFAVLYVVIESWLNELSSNESRGMVFSAYTLITLTMLAAGQQMLLLSDPKDMVLFAAASALVSLAAIPVVLSISPTPAHHESHTRLDLKRLFRISPVGMLGTLSAGLANGSFWALVAVFVAACTNDIAYVAWFMTSAVIGGAIGQWPLGHWSDHVDRRWVIAFAALAGMVLSAAIYLFSDHLGVVQLMLLGGCWGAVAFPTYAVSVAHANDYARDGEFVMLSSSMLLMYGIGAIVGPLLASAVMSLAGPAGLYLFTAAVHALLLLFVLVRMTRRAPIADEEHSTFADSLAATQTASRVYEEEV